MIWFSTSFSFYLACSGHKLVKISLIIFLQNSLKFFHFVFCFVFVYKQSRWFVPDLAFCVMKIKDLSFLKRNFENVVRALPNKCKVHSWSSQWSKKNNFDDISIWLLLMNLKYEDLHYSDLGTSLHNFNDVIKTHKQGDMHLLDYSGL